jgi:hypothetical protein
LDYLFTGNQGYCSNRYNTIKFNWASSTASIYARIVFTSFATGRGFGWWNQYFASFNVSIQKGQVFPIYAGPRGATRVDVYDNSTGKLLLSQDFGVGQLCANPTVTLNLPAPPPTVTLKYVALCPNKTTRVLPPVGTTLYFKETGTTRWRNFYQVNYFNRSQTSLTTDLLTVGKNYDFWVFVGNKSTQQLNVRIPSTNYVINVPLPTRICNSF